MTSMDWGFQSDTPSLVEPGVQYFLRECLHQCHSTKTTYYNTLYNLVLFASFLAFFGFILWYRYKGRPSTEEWERRQVEKQKWILESIRKYNEARQRERQELITGLPAWDNEFDVIRRPNSLIELR